MLEKKKPTWTVTITKTDQKTHTFPDATGYAFGERYVEIRLLDGRHFFIPVEHVLLAITKENTDV